MKGEMTYSEYVQKIKGEYEDINDSNRKIWCAGKDTFKPLRDQITMGWEKEGEKVKEPIYECERCGDTLERWQQGKVTWCTKCQNTWQQGFWAGVKAHQDVMRTFDLHDITDIENDRAPYVVRE